MMGKGRRDGRGGKGEMVGKGRERRFPHLFNSTLTTGLNNVLDDNCTCSWRRGRSVERCE